MASVIGTCEIFTFYENTDAIAYEEAQSGQWDRLPRLVQVCESGAVNTPRHAEESILYSVVAENLRAFLPTTE